MKQFYASSGSYAGVGLDGNVGTFRLAFANAGDIQYCGIDPNCTNGISTQNFALRPRNSADVLTDGNEYNRNGLVPGNTALKRDITSMTRATRNYRTKNGQNIYVPDGANVGDIVWTPKSYDEDLEFDLDEIVGPANVTIV